MAHMKSLGLVVYLELSYEDLLPRLDNLDVRGVVMRSGQTLRDLYNERVPLYRRYADLTVPCGGEDHEASVAQLVASLRTIA